MEKLLYGVQFSRTYSKFKQEGKFFKLFITNHMIIENLNLITPYNLNMLGLKLVESSQCRWIVATLALFQTGLLG